MAFSGKAFVHAIKEEAATAEIVNSIRVAAPLGKDEKPGFLWHGSALQQRTHAISNAFNRAGLEGNTGKYAGMALVGGTVAGGEFINEKIAEKQGGTMGAITRGMGIGAALADTINLRQYARFAAPLAKKFITHKLGKEAGESMGGEMGNKLVQEMGSSSEQLAEYHNHALHVMTKPLFAQMKAVKEGTDHIQAMHDALAGYNPTHPGHLEQLNSTRSGLEAMGARSVSPHPGTPDGGAGDHKVA